MNAYSWPLSQRFYQSKGISSGLWMGGGRCDEEGEDEDCIWEWIDSSNNETLKRRDDLVLLTIKYNILNPIPLFKFNSPFPIY